MREARIQAFDRLYYPKAPRREKNLYIDLLRGKKERQETWTK